MSIVKIQATPTGTGTVTITAPTTNSDRTVTLPDTTGTLYISGGDIGTPSAGNASNLTNLNASNLSTGTIPTGILAVTQAAKTANTTIATTAFVDQLRSLLAQSTSSGGGTLVIGDRGTLVSVTSGVTVPANVFAANDVVTIYNNSAGNITITQGGSLTLRQVGTANTGNRTLAQRGLVTVVFISATEAVISGGGLT
jgi:hypothetical protein